jgi:hypothetical protein
VTLFAVLDTASIGAQVGVLDGTEVPTLAGIDTRTPAIAAGGTVTFRVGLVVPPLAPVTVTLDVAPAGSLTCPATVTIPADALEATVDCAAAPAGGTATVTAALGADQRSATVTLLAGAHLVINELDYDNVGTDTAEFIEVYNPTGATISLAGKALVLVNGTGNTPYLAIALDAAGALAPGQYLVVCTAAVSPAPGAAVLGFDGTLTPGVLGDRIQNGAPDGVALVDTAAGTLLDALSYEGSITATTIAGLTGTVSLVEGTPAAAQDANAAGSLARLPNGVDTDDAATDWKFTGTPTPGAANLP